MLRRSEAHVLHILEVADGTCQPELDRADRLELVAALLTYYGAQGVADGMATALEVYWRRRVHRLRQRLPGSDQAGWRRDWALDASLAELGFPPRALGVLSALFSERDPDPGPGTKVFSRVLGSDLKDLSEEDILAVKGCGAGTMVLIQTRLAELGLSIRRHTGR
ncbi:MAG: hypothetical protein JXC32_19325 [Anaerolineae bacterium]|nr:hypothetical protein [Anaerolineae bacterium]